MSSAQKLATRLLRASTTRPALSQRAIALTRYESTLSGRVAEKGNKGEPTANPSIAPGGTNAESGMIRRENAAEGQPDHAPDYGAHTDYRIS